MIIRNNDDCDDMMIRGDNVQTIRGDDYVCDLGYSANGDDCHAFDNKNEQNANEDNVVRESDKGRENLNTDQQTLIKKFSLILQIRKFQKGAVAKSYMRKGFLIYEEMRKFLVIYEEAVRYI